MWRLFFLRSIQRGLWPVLSSDVEASLETVFERFTCPVYEQEGWGPHSFTTMTEHHCRCNGEGSEY